MNDDSRGKDRRAPVAFLLAAAALLAVLIGIGLRRREAAPAIPGTRAQGGPWTPPAAEPHGEREELRELEWDRDLDVAGVVVTRDSTPVPNALVRISRRGTEEGPGIFDDFNRLSDGPECRTDARGRFQVRLRRGEEVFLEVQASGFGPSGEWCYAGQFLKVVLLPPFQRSLFVEFPDHSPAAGAVVRLQGMGLAGAARVINVGTADERGRLELRNLRPGGFGWLVARDPTGAYGCSLSTGVDDQPSGQETLTLQKLDQLRGVVVRMSDLEPIAGAKILLTRTQQILRSDDAGRFTCEGLLDPDELIVSAEGFCTTRVSTGIGSTATGDHSIRLPASASIRGRLITADGSPAAGARVEIRWEDGGGVANSDAVADELGHFRAADLPAGREVVLRATLEGNRACDAWEVASGEADLGDIVMTVARRLEGRVLDGEGKGIGPCLVSLIQTPGVAGSPPRTSPYDLVDRWERKSDPEGRFRFFDLSPGRYRIEAKFDLLKPAGVVEVNLPADQDVMNAELFLLAGIIARVRVLDDAGNPVEGVLVRADTISGPALSLTKKDGVAELSFDEPANIQVSPSQEFRMEPESTFVRESGQIIEVRAIATKPVSGIVRGPSGEPAGDTLVRARSLDGSVRWSKTDAEGRFSLRISADEVCQLEARQLVGEEDLDDVLRGTAGPCRAGDTNVTITLQSAGRNGSLTVLVLDPNGAPIRGASVDTMVGMDGAKFAETDETGRARFEALFEVPLELVVVPPDTDEDWVISEVHDVVPAGQEVRVQVRQRFQVLLSVSWPDGSDATSDCVINVLDGSRKIEAAFGKNLDDHFALFFDAGSAARVLVLAHAKRGPNRYTASVETGLPASGALQLTLKPSR